MGVNPNDYKPLQNGGDNGGQSFFTRSNLTDKLFDFDDDENEDNNPAGEGGSDDPKGGDPGDPGDDGNGGGDPGSGGAGDPGSDDDDPAGGNDKSKGVSFDQAFFDEEEEEEEEDPDKSGSASKDQSTPKRKEPLIKVFQGLIDEGVLLPFDDDKDLKDYSQKDLQELITSNFEDRKEEMKTQVTNDLFESLPKELQTAMSYVASGGTDMKSLFQQLGTVVELKDLNPEKDAEKIARLYLQASNFGDDELITEQITEWREAGTLGKRAKKFHPSLVEKEDKKNQDAITKAENDRKEKERMGNEFQDSMIEALTQKDLNGIPLNQKLRNSLAEGILTSSHDSKFTSKKTNELFHLIEKYQTSEKNPGLIAEALLLLRNPKAYREEVSKIAIREKDKETVRKLKSSAEKRSGGGASSEEEEPEAKRTRKTVKRKGKGFFQR